MLEVEKESTTLQIGSDYDEEGDLPITIDG